MVTNNKVFINRKFECSTSKLFDYLIQPDLISQWFGPKSLSVGMVKTDFRIGGEYSIELNKSSNQNFFIEGRYIEINIPNELAFTFQYRGLPTPPPKSVVKIKIEALAKDESLLFLTQDFEFTPSDMDNRTKSWEHMFQILQEVIHINTNQLFISKTEE